MMPGSLRFDGRKEFKFTLLILERGMVLLRNDFVVRKCTG